MRAAGFVPYLADALFTGRYLQAGGQWHTAAGLPAFLAGYADGAWALRRKLLLKRLHMRGWVRHRALVLRRHAVRAPLRAALRARLAGQRG